MPSLVSVIWGCVEQQPGIYSRQKCVSALSLSLPFLSWHDCERQTLPELCRVVIKAPVAVCSFLCQLQTHFHLRREWQDPLMYTNEITPPPPFLFSQTLMMLKCLNFRLAFIRTSSVIHVPLMIPTALCWEETGHQIQYICFLSGSILKDYPLISQCKCCLQLHVSSWLFMSTTQTFRS